MKDAEDEAFDELAKKQGMWGGGFQAKRQMAVDKLQDGKCKYCVDGCIACDALAQPAQGPVAFITNGGTGELWWSRSVDEDGNPNAKDIPLYTAPQQRPWVGLTDGEVLETMAESMNSKVLNQKVYEAIEAKLKQKNT